MAALDYGILVPVRAGSVRIPKKNLLPFGGAPSLLEWKLRQLLEVAPGERIIVSSEDGGMQDIARRLGVSVHDRDARLAGGSEVPFHEVIAGIVRDLPQAHIAWCPVTSPLMAPKEYADCFAAYEQQVINGRHDSLVGVNVVRDYLWDEKGPVNYRLDAHPASQDLPPLYRVTNGIYMRAREAILADSYLLGPNAYKQPLSKLAGIDIDEPEDYALACALYPLYVEQRKAEAA